MLQREHSQIYGNALLEVVMKTWQLGQKQQKFVLI